MLYAHNVKETVSPTEAVTLDGLNASYPWIEVGLTNMHNDEVQREVLTEPSAPIETSMLAAYTAAGRRMPTREEANSIGNMV